MDFGGAEVCLGREARVREGAKKALLLGDCAASANRDADDAIRVPGCPPPLADVLKTVAFELLPKGRATRMLLSRTVKAYGMKAGIYSESFPAFPAPDGPEFDRSHF